MPPATTFQYPTFYNFPPFFTIQPTEATKAKQLTLWRSLLLDYHTVTKTKLLVLHDCALFTNSTINRSLDEAAKMIVVEDFITFGLGEWDDPMTKSIVKIFWRNPTQLASDIYQWASLNAFIGTVCTLYEIHSGEDSEGMSFEGADEELIRRALGVLEDRGQCKIFKGETSEEDGIKFF